MRMALSDILQHVENQEAKKVGISEDRIKQQMSNLRQQIAF